MNILFLTMSNLKSIKDREIYSDLMRLFVKKGNDVTIISPAERRYNEKTHIIANEDFRILRVSVGNLQKTNILEKGISTLRIEGQFIKAIKKYLKNVRFDLVLYSTPPITFANVIKYVKKRDKCKSYLMLKDIFPQNAVDLGMFSERSLIYKFFRYKEKKLYALSDYIGCMSEANVEYVKKHNPEISTKIIELCPNSIEIIDVDITDEVKEKIRNKYSIPIDAIVYIYGGNLGEPQGIPFLIECLKTQKDNSNMFFVVVGSGTKFGMIEKYIADSKQSNIKLIKELPKHDYDDLVCASDVGMIFLDSRFTIPNYPSRILKYMQAGIPMLAATDKNTDLRALIEDNNLGKWIESTNVESFEKAIEYINNSNRILMGETAKKCLEKMFDVSVSYNAIMKHFDK